MEKQKSSSAFIDKLIRYMTREDMKRQFSVYVVDPLLNHVMERVFPYIILTLVLFILLLIVVMLILGIIIFQLRKGVPIVMPSAVAGMPPFPPSS